MGSQKLTDRTLFAGTLATDDLVHIVDVSDTSQSPAGSSYKLEVGQLRTFISSGDEGYLPVFGEDGALLNSRVSQDANDVIVTGTTDFTGLTLYKNGKEGGFTVNTANPWIYLQKDDQNNFQLLGGDSKTIALVRGSLEWRDITTNHVYEFVNTLTGFRSLQAPTSTGVSPGALLHVIGSGDTSGTYAFRVDSSSVVKNFAVRDDGIIEAGQGGGGGNSSLKIGQTIGGYGSGSGNVGVGYATLLGLTTGSSNTAIGASAGAAITSGVQNTVIGTAAMYQNLTGNANTAVGYYALQAYTGANNTAFGHRALYTATTGDDCTSVGSASLYNNSTGARNTAIGTNAGFTVNAAGGVYLGYGAGYYETGANKLFIDNALRSNESDGRAKALIYGVFDSSVANQIVRLNASVGVNTAPLSNTQLSVMGIGSSSSSYSLKAEDSSSNLNFSIRDDGAVSSRLGYWINGYKVIVGRPNDGESYGFGYGALAANPTGSNNIAIGASALATVTTGGHNIAIGYNALTNSTATANIGIGYNALTANTSGAENTALGFAALASNISGNSNTAVGLAALEYSTADGNTAVGYYSLLSTTSGAHNTAIGDRSLYTNITGANNVAIGRSAGFTANSSGGVFLGYNAGYFETGANKLFIDNATRSNESDGRAKALIYGVFDSSVANQIVRLNASVGVNTAPLSNTQLSVLGSGSTSGTYGLKIQDSGSNVNFCVVDDGTVGVGISSGLTSKFSVKSNGNAISTFNTQLYNSDGTNIFSVRDNGRMDLLASDATTYLRATPIGTSGGAEIQTNAGFFQFTSQDGEYQFKRGSGSSVLMYTNGLKLSLSAISGGYAGLSISSSTNNVYVEADYNFGIGASTFGTSATSSFAMKTGTAPSTNIADQFALYSADITAGNAAPHFKTETGDVIKLYKYVNADFGNTVNTGDPDTNDLINALVSALTAQGLIST